MEFSSVEIAGVSIEYCFTPPLNPDSPTIIFLHEGLGCGASWRDLPEELATKTGFGTFVYSRRGYGGSSAVQLPRPVNYMQLEGLEALPLLVEHFELWNTILFGHSDGGTIALVACASRMADRIIGAIIEAPHVIIEPITVNSISKLENEYRNASLKRRLERMHGSNTDCAFWGFTNTWLNADNARSWTIVPLLSGITAPLLVIQGERDEFGTLNQISLIKDAVKGPCNLCVIPDSGHVPHFEARTKVIETAIGFISQIQTL